MKFKEEIAAQKGFQLVLDSDQPPQAGQPLTLSTWELECIQPKGASLP